VGVMVAAPQSTQSENDETIESLVLSAPTTGCPTAMFRRLSSRASWERVDIWIENWTLGLRTYKAQHVGSQSAWWMAMYLPGRLQNSHRNGGRVFLIFVADPRTAQLFRNFSRDDDRDTRRGRSVASLGMLMPT
jgi:hypothetical protein